jgi:hypothetical protein
VARALSASEGRDPASADWRTKMSEVHAAVDQLLREYIVQISWKGKPLTERDGPYRIGRRSHANTVPHAESNCSAADHLSESGADGPCAC